MRPRPGPSPSRIAKTIATDSAASRRATKPNTSNEPSSSHWAASTRHISGWASAARRLSVARPTKNRPGAVPSGRKTRLVPTAVDRVASRGGQASAGRAGAARRRRVHLRLDASDLDQSEVGRGTVRRLAQQYVLSIPAPRGQRGKHSGRTGPHCAVDPKRAVRRPYHGAPARSTQRG